MTQSPPDFDLVLGEYGNAIARVAASFEANRALREELVQEILFAIWRALPSFRGQSSLKTFVLRIAHNRAVNHLLSKKNEGIKKELSIDPVDPAANPELQLALQRRSSRFFRASCVDRDCLDPCLVNRFPLA